MSDNSIPDLEWFNSHTDLWKRHFLEKLEMHKADYKKGDARIDGLAFCPRCGSPNYWLSRIGKESQPRSDEPHYYGKHCYTCSYHYDPKKEVKASNEPIFYKEGF